jgi:peptide-methionine (R)-S-oxide reductase
VKHWFVFLSIALLGAIEWNGEKTIHSEKEWREILGQDRYNVMRQKSTEHAYLGKYVYTQGSGVYSCAACSLPLFDGREKYDAGNGYPSFKKPIAKKNVYYLEDWTLPFKRYEVLCRGCDSHLGHLFNDGPPPKHLRYCINSITLKYKE